MSAEALEKESSEYEQLKQKVEDVEKRNKKLQKQIQQLKTGQNKSRQKTGEKDKLISRRQFIKKAGVGTATLVALGLAPASALNLQTDSFQVSTGQDQENLQQYFSVGQEGPVSIQNTTLGLPTFSSDPDASQGEIWYREDLD